MEMHISNTLVVSMIMIAYKVEHSRLQFQNLDNFNKAFMVSFPWLNFTLEIRNSSQNGLSVPDANLVSVSSTLDIISLMNLGQRNRAVGATALNDRSSRSHR